MDRLTRNVALSCLVVYLAIAFPAALHGAFPGHVDELAQLSYVASIAQSGLAGISLPAMHMLNPDLAPGFTDQLNYLDHPPFYYLLLSQLLPADGWPTHATVVALRLVNLALSSLAVACTLAIGLVRRLPPGSFALYALMVLVTPVLWGVGAAINNDNLAILGGAIAVLGAEIICVGPRASAVVARHRRASPGHLQGRPVPRGGSAILAAGCVLATLAKLTAGLMVTGFAALFLLIRVRKAERPSGAALATLAVLVLAACLPYLWFLIEYGSPAPVTGALINEYQRIATLLASHAGDAVHFWQPGAEHGFASYAMQFAWWLLADWNPVFTPSNLSLVALAAPVMMLALATLAWLRAVPTLRDAVILAGGLAMAMLVPLHLMFSWRMYRLVGSPPFDAIPRYYLPLSLSVIPLAASRAISELPDQLRRITTVLLAIAVCTAPLVILATQ